MMVRTFIWSSLLLLLPVFSFGQWTQPGDRYVYDFSSTVITLANESYFDFTDSLTLEFDVKFDDVTTGSWQGVIAKRQATGGNTVFGLNVNGTTNTFQWYINDGGGFKIHTLTLRTYFSAATWYHLKCSFTENGANVDSEIIIDGGTPLTTTLTSVSIAANTASVTLGASYGTSEYFNGKLDNVKITGDGATVSYLQFKEGTGTTLSDRMGNADGTITAGSGSWTTK